MTPIALNHHVVWIISGAPSRHRRLPLKSVVWFMSGAGARGCHSCAPAEKCEEDSEAAGGGAVRELTLCCRVDAFRAIVSA